MALKLIVAAFTIFVIAHQCNAGCICPPPSGAYGGLSFPGFSLPASLPCPPVQTKITQHPDINIPLPLPAEIPLGNFCSCQKYGITPALLPCSPAASASTTTTTTAAPATTIAPCPAPAPIPCPSAPAISLSPSLLQALLRSVPTSCA